MRLHGERGPEGCTIRPFDDPLLAIFDTVARAIDSVMTFAAARSTGSSASCVYLVFDEARIENEAVGYRERETAYRVLKLAPVDLETGGYHVSMIRAVAARVHATACVTVWRSDGSFIDGCFTTKHELILDIEREGEPDERRTLALDTATWMMERDTRTFEVPILSCHVDTEPRHRLVRLAPVEFD